MAQSGRLPASRFGRALMIKESDLALVADRKPGRPPKAAAKETDAGDQVEPEAEEIGEKPKRRTTKKAPVKKASKRSKALKK
jgi:hypothetical protein